MYGTLAFPFFFFFFLQPTATWLVNGLANWSLLIFGPGQSSSRFWVLPNCALLLLLLYRQRPATHEGLVVSSRPHIQRGRIRIFSFPSHDISAMFHYPPLSATIITAVSPGFPNSVSDCIALSLPWLKPSSTLSLWNLQLHGPIDLFYSSLI